MQVSEFTHRESLVYNEVEYKSMEETAMKLWFTEVVSY